MKHFAAWLGPLGLVAALVAPGDARACSPQRVERVRTIPLTGTSHPANAPISLGVDVPSSTAGYELSFADFEVTVDGVAATLVSAKGMGTSALSAPYFEESNLLLVSPEPKAGQRVVVRGPFLLFCDTYDVDDPKGSCPPNELAYTATAPDTAPPAVPAVTFDVRVYDPQFNCKSEPAPTYFAHFPAPEEGGAAAPVTYVLEGYTNATLTERTFRRAIPADRSNLDLPLTGVDNATTCLRLQAFDLAGNESSASALECALPPLPPPPTNEADDAGDDGCQLAAPLGAGPAPWAGLLAAAALAAGGLRRRRARGPKTPD